MNLKIQIDLTLEHRTGPFVSKGDLFDHIYAVLEGEDYDYLEESEYECTDLSITEVS